MDDILKTLEERRDDLGHQLALHRMGLQPISKESGRYAQGADFGVVLGRYSELNLTILQLGGKYRTDASYDAEIEAFLASIPAPHITEEDVSAMAAA